jgi:glycolate oxidase
MKNSLSTALREIVGSTYVMDEQVDMLAYSYDAAVLDQVMPAVVVRPGTGEELGKIVRLCNDSGTPLTVRGAGTNLSGGTVPREDSVVVLTGRLNKIIELNVEDRYALVEPGVITLQLARAAEKQGLFYPPDPGSQAVSTLGGNVAENAGGLRGLKYGVTRDYVMGLDFFDVNGHLVTTGAKTVKCVTGYDLASLMVGSEGTLGVLSRITLKLIPRPAARKAIMAVFADMQPAAETVAAIIASKITPAVLEFLDNLTIKAVESHSKAGFPVQAAAMLLIEMDGHPVQVEEEAILVEKICRRQGAVEVRLADNQAEYEQIWAARRGAFSALAKLKPTVILEDATVPRSKIPAMVKAIGEIAGKYNLDIGTFGHAGDGNLHPTILTDRRDRKEQQRVEAAIDEIFERALALGGTLSGEHGIGLAKAKYLHRETTEATIAWSRKIKQALDPNSVLNPGKIIA